MDGGVYIPYLFSAVVDTWYRTLIPHMLLDAVRSVDPCTGGFNLLSHAQFLNYQIASGFSLFKKSLPLTVKNVHSQSSLCFTQTERNKPTVWTMYLCSLRS